MSFRLDHTSVLILSSTSTWLYWEPRLVARQSSNQKLLVSLPLFAIFRSCSHITSTPLVLEWLRNKCKHWNNTTEKKIDSTTLLKNYHLLYWYHDVCYSELLVKVVISLLFCWMARSSTCLERVTLIQGPLNSLHRPCSYFNSEWTFFTEELSNCRS